MDLINLGSGAATGFVASCLTLLGWNRRLNKLEDGKQEKSTCEKIHEEAKVSQKKMEDDITYIRGRVDKLIDLKMNGK